MTPHYLMGRGTRIFVLHQLKNAGCDLKCHYVSSVRIGLGVRAVVPLRIWLSQVG